MVTPNDTLLADVLLARQQLPTSHQRVLDAIGVNEVVHETWPEPVRDLYRTLRKPPPPATSIESAAAVWLEDLRTVAFNGPALRSASQGLDEPSRRRLVAAVAWHEYGHALSVTLAGDEQRRRGPELLALAPPALQSVIGQGGYRRGEVFDELVAGVYGLLVAAIHDNHYGVPDYLDRTLFEAFKEVIPWPPDQ